MKTLLNITKNLFIAVLALAAVLALVTIIYMQQTKFGKTPIGQRLAQVKQSPNYSNGEFQNISATPTLAPGYSMLGEIRKQLFNKNEHTRPPAPLPSVRTDLKHLPADSNLLVWFGHSSSFIQLNGVRILIDPVFSDNASPIPGSVKAFAGSNVYSADDMPEIDYLLISHDHYDHLDYPTITALKAKIKHVICGLGTGAHFERWGYSAAQIIERDWWQQVEVAPGYTIHTLPARHKSGRGFKQNQALWLSYLIQAPGFKLFYSGDGGYDKHFAAIGKKFGPVDFALIENGQYNEAWHYVHMLPPESVQAALDVRAARMMPVHNSKFALARHNWDEPMRRVCEIAQGKLPVVTPMIGQVVQLNNTQQVFEHWWQNVK